MRTFARYALSIGVAGVLLAACGESRPPISAPGAVSQTSAFAGGTHGTNYAVVYSFGGPPDGGGPVASLINVGGTLYGTTAAGGSHGFGYCGNPGCGTVFSVAPGGTEKVLHSFDKSPDGNLPDAGLIDVGGTLYGTTSAGGSYSCFPSISYSACGTVFSVTPSGVEKVLHSFAGRADGSYPVAPLIKVKGKLYGTTQDGGRRNCRCGTVFSITPSGAEKVLHSFGARRRGSYPVAPLIEVKGKLYGTTQDGGAYGFGTVFSVTLGGAEKVLHSFGYGTDGIFPNAALINVGGTLYGTTELGADCYSTSTCGTVFSITLNGAENVLHRFTGDPDGAYPLAGLIKMKGKLYGTTSAGGTYLYGTIFSITTSGTEKVLHSFAGGTEGGVPHATLTNVGGTLYGTTPGGGTHGHGTVFAFTP